MRRVRYFSGVNPCSDMRFVAPCCASKLRCWPSARCSDGRTCIDHCRGSALESLAASLSASMRSTATAADAGGGPRYASATWTPTASPTSLEPGLPVGRGGCRRPATGPTSRPATSPRRSTCRWSRPGWLPACTWLGALVTVAVTGRAGAAEAITSTRSAGPADRGPPGAPGPRRPGSALSGVGPRTAGGAIGCRRACGSLGSHGRR